MIQGELFDEPGSNEAPDLPDDWLAALSDQFQQPYWQALQSFLSLERESSQVLPPPEDVFAAFRFTPLEKVRVLILGQDPYHGVGQAHGLCFSVRPAVAIPASLRNIYKELRDDLAVPPSQSGCLTRWAEQGVLLLNAVLTVRAGEANSHKDRGWERFTDAVIDVVNARLRPTIFVLWGAYAQKKEKLIDASRHSIIRSAHPSPLSASNGFFGSRPFSRINSLLGDQPIDWRVD